MNEKEFLKGMKILQASYVKDFDTETLDIWYRQLKNINGSIFIKSVEELVTKNKYMPSIAEIIEESNKQQEKSRFKILDIMKADNYFKSPEEYVKATKWLETNIIPSWFKNDMMRYYKQSPVLTNGEVKYLN